MFTIELTEQELAIREQLIKAASTGNKLYYSDLVNGTFPSEREELGQILEKITRYDIENKQPILASIAVFKSTGLPGERFFELCDMLDIDARLSDLQQECFVYWKTPCM